MHQKSLKPFLLSMGNATWQLGIGVLIAVLILIPILYFAEKLLGITWPIWIVVGIVYIVWVGWSERNVKYMVSYWYWRSPEGAPDQTMGVGRSVIEMPRGDQKDGSEYAKAEARIAEDSGYNRVVIVGRWKL